MRYIEATKSQGQIGSTPYYMYIGKHLHKWFGFFQRLQDKSSGTGERAYKPAAPNTITFFNNELQLC
jgi:hypothetical protein